MSTCEENMDKMLEILHTNVVWSNIFYLIAGVYAFMKHQYGFGTLVLLVGIVSILHHSNYNLLFSKRTWSVIDVLLSNILAIVVLTYIAVTQYNYFKNNNKLYTPYTVIIIISLFSFIFFIRSTIEKFNNSDYEDQDVGVLGPVLADVNPDTCKSKTKRVISTVYHIMWHIISGILAIFFVMLLPNKNIYIYNK